MPMPQTGGGMLEHLARHGYNLVKQSVHNMRMQQASNKQTA